MNVSPTQSQASQPTGGDYTAITGGTDLGQQDFLQLLVAELRNQDPLQPTDDKEFIAELAQFNTLSQIQQLNQTVTAMAGLSLFSQSASLIGKWVDVSPTSTAGTSGGVVTQVDFSNQDVVLKVGGKDVRLADVIDIKQNSGG